MNVERFENLRMRAEFKNRNGVDSLKEIGGMIEEYERDYPNITSEELDQLMLEEYCNLYNAFNDTEPITNMQHMLRHLKELLKQFKDIYQLENIIKQKVSDRYKQYKLSMAEEKLSVLLSNLSLVILDYVTVPIGIQDEENSNLWKANEEVEKVISLYMRASLETGNINNLGIDRIYKHIIIPFYQKLYETIQEALNQNNEILLWQIAEVSVCKVVFRCKLMANLLK